MTKKALSNKILIDKAILLIEDDEYVLRVYTKWLRLAGAEVAIANNGALGLDILKEQKVDLVLLDLGMPGMDGYETLKRLRANPETKNTPVVILSNTTMNESRDGFQELMDLGVVDILRKFETSLNELTTCVFDTLAKGSDTRRA